MLLSGFLQGYSAPKEKYGYLLTLGNTEVRARGHLQNSTPYFWEEFNVLLTDTSVGWMFALTQRFQLKNSFPAAGIPIVSALTSPSPVSDQVGRALVGMTGLLINREIFLLVLRGKTRQVILPEFLHNNRTIIFINTFNQTF